MSAMELEYLLYSFTGRELALLLALLSCEAPPLLSLPDTDWETAMARLREDGIVQGSGLELAVDEVTAFLIRSVGTCRQYLCLSGSGAYLGLFRTELASFVLRSAEGRCLLAPFEHFSEARRYFLEEPLPAAPLRAELRNPAGRWRCAAERPETLAELTAPEALEALADQIPRETPPAGARWTAVPEEAGGRTPATL